MIPGSFDVSGDCIIDKMFAYGIWAGVNVLEVFIPPLIVCSGYEFGSFAGGLFWLLYVLFSGMVWFPVNVLCYRVHKSYQAYKESAR